MVIIVNIIIITLTSNIKSNKSSSTATVFIVNFDDSSTCVVPRNQVTFGSGLALQRHFIVIREPVAFGVIFGFSTKVGAMPPSSPPSMEKHRSDGQKENVNQHRPSASKKRKKEKRSKNHKNKFCERIPYKINHSLYNNNTHTNNFHI